MTPKELAAAIRKGHTMIGEARLEFWSRESNCGCALGAAFAGIGFTPEKVNALLGYNSSETHKAFAPILGITPELSRQISMKHVGGMPRLEVADWLDTLDVSKPKDAQTFSDFMKVVTQPVELVAA